MKAAGDILFFATFFGYLLFCILFFRSHWWRSAIGRHIFAFMAVPTVLMGLGVVSRVAGRPWFEVHRVELVFWSYLALAIVVWWRVGILVLAQKFSPEAAMARNDRQMDALEESEPKRDGDNTDPNIMAPT